MLYRTLIHKSHSLASGMTPSHHFPTWRLPLSPPRVSTRSRRLSPCNLPQENFCGMDTSHMAISLGDNHWSRQHLANAVIPPVTGKDMEYTALMKDPQLKLLWTRVFGNKCGRLFQGIPEIAGTNISFFIRLTDIPKDRKITYGKIVCD
jgi:hypothetical protein